MLHQIAQMEHEMNRLLTLLLAPGLLLGGTASASTDEAWEIFRQDVTAACLALLNTEGEVAMEVNPFGSERFGLALATLTTAGGVERIGCIFDKASGAAELTAPFEPMEQE